MTSDIDAQLDAGSEEFQLAYVGLEISDKNGFDRYLASTVGLVEGESGELGVSVWRTDEKCHRILVAEGPSDDVTFAGFEFPDAAALGRAVDRLTALGATVAHEPEIAAQRRVRELVSVVAPWGVRLELTWGLDTVDGPFEAPLMPGGFVTGDLGLGHVVFYLNAAQLDDATRFVTAGLGMQLSDYIQLPGSSDRGDFYHANGRHHSLAFVPLPAPRKLHHIMVETVSHDNVGMAFDRAVAAELEIPHGLGKHANDGMFSFYMKSPAGFQIEVGTGAVVVNENWQVLKYDQVSSWGHQRYTPAPKPSALSVP